MKIPKLQGIYEYIPPCPVCRSRQTGRYVKTPYTPQDRDYTMEQSLLNGELIRFAKNVPVNNAFCEECGHEWEQKIRIRTFPDPLIQREIAARNTMDKYERYRKEAPPKKKRRKGTGLMSLAGYIIRTIREA